MTRLFALSLAYLATGWLGLQVPYTGSHITLVWLPTGIAVAALLRWGRGVWPGIALGAFLVNLAIGSTVPLAAGIAVGNTLGPLLAVWWLRRVEFSPGFERQRDVGAFIAAACLGMLLSASGGVANLYLAGLMSADAIPPAWLTWWMGDTVGVLLAAPLLLTLTRSNLARLRREGRESLLWLVAAGTVAWLAFIQDFPALGRTLPLAFLSLPLLAWAALRFGVTGATAASLAFSLAAAWGTAKGHGTFHLPDAHVGLLLLWSYMGTAVLTGLFITALLAERRQAENTLRASEEKLRVAKEAAEAASLAKSQFLATMSHEIRTPLNGVLGMAQLLLMDGSDEQERREYARTILNSGQTLLAILNDILDLSKAEAGKIEIEHIVFAPAQLLREAASLFDEIARGKGLALEADWRALAGKRYRGDPTRLRQVLSNLVSNAIKFSAAGTVRIHVEEIGASGAETLLCFYVDDKGAGIPPELGPLLFQPFAQADASITRRFGGTGLGLAIAWNLVRLMGGDIGVESVPGAGSTFWFTARVGAVGDDDESRSEERALDAMMALADRSPHRILVVEDNATNRQVVCALLHRQGHATRVAENGRAAVELVAAGAYVPELVLMDIQMPEMDGLEATRRLRLLERERGLPHLPIIALTAGAYAEDRERCAAAGMDDFLAKPLDIDALAAVLARWLKPTRAADGASVGNTKL